MRVRVRFRYNTETGEVETFVVEDIGGARPGGDHDAVHDALTADVARIVERNALIEEVRDAADPERAHRARSADPAPDVESITRRPIDE